MIFTNTWDKPFAVPAQLQPLTNMICLHNSGSVAAKIVDAFHHLEDLDFEVTAVDDDYIEAQLNAMILSITWSTEMVVLDINVKINDIMLCCEGNIGVGKSTLTRTLSDLGFGDLRVEEVNEKLLSQFYAHPKQYGFTFQLYMLAHRLAQANHIQRPVVIDRGILGDSVFASVAHANGIISDTDYEIYLDMIKAHRPHPDMITLYLHAKPSVCLSRLQQRDRHGESGIDLMYLEAIDREHFEAIIAAMLAGDTTVIVDWNEFGEVHGVSMALVKAGLTGLGHEQFVSREHGRKIDWNQDHDYGFRNSVWQCVLNRECVQLENYHVK